MATKTISITEEAYERLQARKKGRESFTEVINRITGKSSLLDYAGLLSANEAKMLEEKIRDSRKKSRSRMERIAKAMQ